MTPSKIILSLCFGFLGGVTAGSLLPFSWVVVQIAILVIFSLMLFVRSNTLRLFLCVLVSVTFIVGYVYVSIASPVVQSGGAEAFSATRLFFVERTSQVIGGVERGMFLAMVLGWRDELTQEIKSIFNRTGTRHILAISGMHLTIVAAVLLELLVSAGLMRTKAFWVALGGIAVFTLLVGAPPSATRAAIMAALYLVAQQIGRITQAWRLLVVAAAGMVAINPHLLMRSVGFQLSFSAVLGIILYKPFFDSVLSFVSWRPLRDLLSLSLAAQITTWPILASTFGRVSLVGPIANLIAVPVLPIVMLLGLSFLFVGWINIVLAKVVLYPAWALLHTLVAMLEPLSTIPWAEISVGNFTPVIFVVYYGMLTIGYFFFTRLYEHTQA